MFFFCVEFQKKAFDLREGGAGSANVMTFFAFQRQNVVTRRRNSYANQKHRIKSTESKVLGRASATQCFFLLDASVRHTSGTPKQSTSDGTRDDRV